MTFIEESLSKGEKVHEVYKLHWFSKIPMVIWIVLALPTVGLTLILAIYEWFRLRSLELGTTNKRVILKSGIISRKTEEMKIGSIETVEIDQSIFGRMFGFGNVKVSGRGISDVAFNKIDNPMAVKKSIESIDTF
ncbi:MAG: putative membrane protein YdbT with pleckstrin-like domain [Polaribacter sp.]|jgi:uncharacterized membrane protein YdbT with pleckstrin-like domain